MPTISQQTHVDLLGLDDAATTSRIIWQWVATASAGLCAYHGYKRNRGSIGWAIGWGLLGGTLPVLAPAIALGQGLGKPRKV